MMYTQRLADANENQHPNECGLNISISCARTRVFGAVTEEAIARCQIAARVNLSFDGSRVGFQDLLILGHIV